MHSFYATKSPILKDRMEISILGINGGGIILSPSEHRKKGAIAHLFYRK